MTDDQLDAIETALEIRLPPAYRSVSRAFPFRPIGRDWVYWFYDDPEAVIHSNRHPYEDGGYVGPALLPRYAAIGESGAGDLYLLDVTLDGAPIAIMSHETHAIESGWATFETFVDEWVAAPGEWDRQRAVERAVRRRRYLAIVGATALCVFGLLSLLLCLIPRR